MAKILCAISGGGSSSGNALVGQVLAGRTFSNDDGTDLVGIMPNQGSVSIILDTSITSYTISNGYHDGTGSVSISTQEKTVTPTTSSQSITPDSGKVLSKVTVNAISTQEKSVNAGTSSKSVTPDSGKYLSKVTIGAISNTNLSAGNIKRGTTITIKSGSNTIWSISGSTGNGSVVKCVTGSINLKGGTIFEGDLNNEHWYLWRKEVTNIGITPMFAYYKTEGAVSIYRINSTSGYMSRRGYASSPNKAHGYVSNFSGGWSSSSISIIGNTQADTQYYIFGS